MADKIKVQHRKYGRFKLRSDEVYDHATIASEKEKFKHEVLYKVRTETGQVHIVQEPACYIVNIVYSLRNNNCKNAQVRLLSISVIVTSWLSSDWTKKD
jgi:hypothetical protein